MHEAIELGNWRARIRQEEADLREWTIHAVRSLSEEGYSVRDIAGAVGLTPGWIKVVIPLEPGRALFNGVDGS